MLDARPRFQYIVLRTAKRQQAQPENGHRRQQRQFPFTGQKEQIKRNISYNTNFQVITQDKPPANNTSGVKGVSWNKEKKSWDAYINVHGKRIRLGRYGKFEDAVKARKRAEEEYFQPLIEELKNNL